jgi:catechol 2,3-dioxygenase
VIIAVTGLMAPGHQAAGGYHHHIGLNTWMSRNADPAPTHSAGLFHLAILYPERRDLALALKWLLESN